MSVTTKIDVERNVIVHYFSEYISYTILSETIEKTLSNPKYQAGMNAVWICDDNTKIDMTSEETYKLSEYARLSFDKSGVSYKLALVANEDLAYGMTRVYEGLSNDRPIEINNFRKIDDAFAWIEG